MNSFTPLTGLAGKNPAILFEKLNNKHIIIWGAGVFGKNIKRIINNFFSSEKILFCDSNRRIIGSRINGAKIISINEAVDKANLGEAVILIAIPQKIQYCTDLLILMGLQNKENLYNYLQIQRPEAVIELFNGKSHYIKTEDFKKIINKLKSEYDYLFQIDLSGFNDPICHPELMLVIDYAEQFASASIVTDIYFLEEKIKEIMQLNKLNQLIFRIGNNFDLNKILKKLNDLSRIIKNTDKEIKTEIRVRYDVYNNNTINQKEVFKHCTALGIKIVSAVGYPNNYDQLLEFNNIGEHKKNISEINNLIWEPTEAIKVANNDIRRDCLCQRIFPVIESDMSVSNCHLYTKFKIDSNYLSLNKEDLDNKRKESKNCRVCQMNSLHRLDIEYMLNKGTMHFNSTGDKIVTR